MRHRFRGSVTRLINTYTCPWAKIPSRQPRTFPAMVRDWTLCRTSAYAGPKGSCTRVDSCGAASITAVTSTQSTCGRRTRCSAEDSWQNRAQRRSSFAGIGLRPPAAAGSQERSRPVAPFANRVSGSTFATSITRIMCGRSFPGHGGSRAHCPARCRLGRHWDRTRRVILAMFVALRYQPARLPLGLKLAFTFSDRAPLAVIRFNTWRFHRFR